MISKINVTYLWQNDSEVGYESARECTREKLRMSGCTRAHIRGIFNVLQITLIISCTDLLNQIV